ncbi:MAG: hypothetical protein PHH75_08080 [Candidatus Omnitrophica bacterium]|nr:hypothetical protein [Candidatus Omnitrophota bacterium]MDD5575116.1 hypothetical protein [Candidatus Omnitrophota bacterium]
MKKFTIVLGAFLMLFCLASFVFAQDQITITTYYPSPFGIYSDLRASRIAVGNSRPFGNSGEVTWGGSNSVGSLTNDQGASIELGGTLGGYTPYIDFHNDSGDFDSRIILLSNNVLGIYVRDRVEIRNTNTGGYADIGVGDIYLCT